MPLPIGCGRAIGRFTSRREAPREIRQLAQGLDALRQELAATWRAVPDLMFELDEHGRYLRVVASRSDLVVRDPMELIGRLVSDVLPPSAAAVVHLALSDAARQGAVWGRELALDVPAGQRWFEISVGAQVGAGANVRPHSC